MKVRRYNYPHEAHLKKCVPLEEIDPDVLGGHGWFVDYDPEQDIAFTYYFMHPCDRGENGS